jgi:ParB family chromosome partitioning protein
MAKLKGLGRGLDALLATSTVADDRLTTLSIDLIRPGKYQPRSHMDEAALDELAASIRAQGDPAGSGTRSWPRRVRADCR